MNNYKALMFFAFIKITTLQLFKKIFSNACESFKQVFLSSDKIHLKYLFNFFYYYCGYFEYMPVLYALLQIPIHLMKHNFYLI